MDTEGLGEKYPQAMNTITTLQEKEAQGNRDARRFLGIFQ